MKMLAVVLFFAATACAQSTPIAFAPACGAAAVKFDVKTDKTNHSTEQPQDGKALVYFVEDDTEFESFPKPTTRIGLDGEWVGANHGNSYFSFVVSPGEHHLCASWQSLVIVGAKETSAVAHFTAEAGKVYYFRIKNTWLRVHAAQVDLSPLDSDEGMLLAGRYGRSVSHTK